MKKILQKSYFGPKIKAERVKKIAIIFLSTIKDTSSFYTFFVE